MGEGYAAINQIFRVINEQSQGSFDENFNFISYYNWTGGNGALAPMVYNRGNGEPKAYTGMFSSPASAKFRTDFLRRNGRNASQA
jgi:hypothetical protein